MTVLICGSRTWSSFKSVHDKILALADEAGGLDGLLIIEGECRGADAMARQVCQREEIDFHAYPARWRREGKSAGARRNKRMLDHEPRIERIVAFHKDIASSVGTKDMIERAAFRNIPVEIIAS